MVYALIPDETHCKSELGQMLYKNRKDYGFHPEIVEIIEPKTFLGHVDYVIQITATPNNTFDSEAKNFRVTSRFKELNGLYSALLSVHKQLYLKGTVPGFVEAKFFGSTAPEVIEERKNAINDFLKFVLNNEVLCKARVFQQFLEKSHLVSLNTDISNSNDIPEQETKECESNTNITLAAEGSSENPTD